MWTQKCQAVMTWLFVPLFGFCWGLCRLRWHRDGIFREFQIRCLGPSWGTLKSLAQKFIHELGHGNSAAFAFMVQGGDKEPGELRRIMTGSGHRLPPLMDVAVVTDSNHLDACLNEVPLYEVVGGMEDGGRENHLDGDDEVEGDECFFHGWVQVDEIGQVKPDRSNHYTRNDPVLWGGVRSTADH